MFLNFSVILKKTTHKALHARVSRLAKHIKSYIYSFLLKRNDRHFLPTLTGLTYCKFSFLDQVLPIRIVESELECTSISPDYEDQPSKTCKVNAPSICVYALNHVIGKIHSSNFVVGEKLILERVPHVPMEYSDYATGILRAHDEKGALIKFSGSSDRLLTIESGIFLGGNGAWNYYHWMTEILPKIEVLIKSNIFEDCKTILVSRSVKEVGAFYKTLVSALSDFNIEIKYIDPDLTFEVDKLYVVNPPCSILFNSKKKLTDPSYSFYRKKSLDWVRELVLRDLCKNICPAQDELSIHISRVFLARKDSAYRNYNQEEIEKFLVEKYGFTSIFIEDYTIEQQAFIFNTAELIVGPSGAAWTNLIFCNSGTLAISWLSDNLCNFSAFSTIASLYGVKMRFVHASTMDKVTFHADYKVSVCSIEREIETML